MARLSREKKREQEQGARAANRAAVPIDVRVPAAGAGPGGASVGGVPVTAAPGEEIQQAVLDHLHRAALASGRAVLATVHDERIGYVLPLRVDPDGSSHFTARPVPAARERRPERGRGPLRVVPEPAGPVPPGTVAPPAGAFGPPPVMDARPRPLPVPDAGRPGGPASRPRPGGTRPDPAPAPPRGFDAVAEAVLGDGPPAAGDATAPALLAEPAARVNEAVRTGRLDTAARLARRTVAEASGTLGPEHPEVLRLRELTAYIAYLAGDPLNAFRLCLDLAAIHRRAGDAEAAYGNVRGAATAWRAVRDAELGLELGRELIGLWAGLTAEGGPAADEAEELESARARMVRLAGRARARQD